METIKVEIDVNVNFGEKTMTALRGIFGCCGTFAPVSDCDTPEPEPEAAKPAAPRRGRPAKPVVPAVPAEPKPEAVKPEAVKPEAVKPVAGQAVTVDMVREALAAKISDHRPQIKQKLTDLGATSVTALDPEKYAEMYEFLMGL